MTMISPSVCGAAMLGLLEKDVIYVEEKKKREKKKKPFFYP
jgi:hypothetical protein